jgi:hypothetical protein
MSSTHERIIRIIAWLGNQDDGNWTGYITLQAGRCRSGGLWSFGIIEVSSGAFISVSTKMDRDDDIIISYQRTACTWNMFHDRIYKARRLLEDKIPSHIGGCFVGIRGAMPSRIHMPMLTVCGRFSAGGGRLNDEDIIKRGGRSRRQVVVLKCSDTLVEMRKGSTVSKRAVVRLSYTLTGGYIVGTETHLGPVELG